MEANCRQKHTDGGISLFWAAQHGTSHVIQLMDANNSRKDKVA